jgi:anaerobic selenocysteine-containing dehydrogenase
MQRAFSFAYTLGVPSLSQDFENSDLIVIWGANPVYSSMSMGNLKSILDARDRGARLMVIKPEMQPDAAKADIWVPVRPGTDGALALAMLNVIINENLYDKEFVPKWCFRFRQAVPHIRGIPRHGPEPITRPAEKSSYRIFFARQNRYPPWLYNFRRCLTPVTLLLYCHINRDNR